MQRMDAEDCRGRSKRRNVLPCGHIARFRLASDMSEGQRGLLKLHIERHSGPAPVLQGYGKPSFLTHAHSRLFPFSVLRSGKAEQLVVRVAAQRGISQPKRRSASRQSLNLSIDSCSRSEVPRIDYRRYRAMHLQRQNSTNPGSRDYSDYSNTNLPAAQRLYQPSVIRLSARSRLVLHSAADH